MHIERLKAILAISVILRSFKFLTIINSLDILAGTIRQQFEYIQAFFLAVMVMLAGYSMAAYLIFGQDDEFYSPPPPNPIPTMPDDVLYPFKIDFASVVATVALLSLI